jgi:multidrug efflux pump subunit AcrA (membrane-fusion protein)
MVKQVLALGVGLMSCAVVAVAQSGGDFNGSIYTVRSVPVGATVTLGGTVTPDREVTLSAQMPGRVEIIAGEEGDFFKKNTLLVRLDDDELRAQWAAAAADLANAGVAWRNAGVQFNRELLSPKQETVPGGMGLPSLFERTIVDPMRFMAPDQMMAQGSPRYERFAYAYGYHSQLEQARNSYFQAQSRMRQIEASVRDTLSVAPFDGVIVKKFVEVGDTVQPGQPLLQFADMRRLQIRVDVPARLMPGVKRGMQVTSHLDVGNRQVQAWVARIWPVADAQRHTVTVEFDLAPGAPAGPGMYAEVTIPDISAPMRNLPVIPKKALIRRGSLQAVYVIKGTGEPHEDELRMVRVGDPDPRDPQYVSILSGLEPGERIRIRHYPEISGGRESGWTGAK